MRKNNFPIIHIIGLLGAGKTALAKKLSKRFSLSIYRIGEYRFKFPQTAIGEINAWVKLFYDLSKKKKYRCFMQVFVI